MKTKSLPEQSMLMDKWSSRPAEYNTNRVRNNQRRHRARVKSRMEELEGRLEETNARLEAALSTIRDLTAEVEDLRAGRSSTLAHSEFPRSLAPLSLVESASPVLDYDPQHPQATDTLPLPSRTHIAAPTPTSHATKQQAELASPAPTAIDSDSICNCPAGAPPPALGESTMSCSSAFQIIEQQNFSGVEVTMIKAWLGPGFRLKPGEACRVETNRLYELIDHITSPS